MPKFVFMPPQDEENAMFAARLSDTVPEYEVVSPESDEEALEAIRDADAVYGWVSPEALRVAEKLRWVQNPQAGPFYGYYYDELIEHPLTICNPRGIYFDHISHHIMMFVFALSRGLPWYMEAQRQRVWDEDARRTPYVFLGDSTALINGVGGIGHETARLCNELGMEVIGIDPRPEYDLPYVEFHTPEEIDEVLPRADFVITTVPHTPETEGMFDVGQVQADEGYGVLHQHRSGEGVPAGRPGGRGGEGRNRGRGSGRVRGGAAAVGAPAVGYTERADDAAHSGEGRGEYPGAAVSDHPGERSAVSERRASDERGG